MKRIVWLTDVHFNFVPRDEVVQFLLQVAKHNPDAVLITGDIAESTDVCDYLQQMAKAWDCPIYFVLGNHDYYYGSIRQVREQVNELCRHHANMHYLTEQSAVQLAPGVGLLGHDGWADARYGDYLRSYVMMHDYRLIEELAGLDKLARWEVLHQLGDAAAAATRPRLQVALEQFDQVYLITHVPPLLEACWHEGRLSDEQWSPHFTCRAMGEMILDTMSQHASKQLTVLCGHTHGSGEAKPLENVVIHTGGAEYGRPEIVRFIDM
jgi:predicted MPP superfamily phosphohydrolase